MEYFLLHYGYAFLVLGLILEGDATLVAATILAAQQYFSLRAVVLIALGVTVGGNELLYEIGALGFVGGLLGDGKHRQRVSRWLHSSRSGLLSLLFSRFMWGFRLMIPVAAGMLHIKRRRFSLANLVGGVIWVGLLVYFGVALQSLFVLLHDDLMLYQSHIAVGLFLAGVIVGLATIPWQITRSGLKRRSSDCMLGLEAAAAPLVPAKPPRSTELGRKRPPARPQHRAE